MSSIRAKKPYNRTNPRPRASDGSWLHDMHDNAPVVQESTAPSSSTRVLVTNLHYELTPKDLMSVFGQVGTLVQSSADLVFGSLLVTILKYDRSGRSSGIAVITYELPDEAARAIAQYNGATANGQMMTVEYDKAPPIGQRQKRRASAPPALINRIQKPPLLERLGNSTATSPTNISNKHQGTGPIRTKAARVIKSGPKRPKTAEELDQELDYFMKDEPKVAVGKVVEASTNGSNVPTQAPVKTAADTDVEMS